MAENRFASLDAPAPEATDESASALSPDQPDSAAPADIPVLSVVEGVFDPVALRHRSDGWTPERQREYVEALADTGVARQAAALVGMSEQSVNRLRRRADARSFDLACEAAIRFGARRLRSIAFERAIEGTVKRHHYHDYHGEVVSEERVYDNRLLVYLLGRTEHLLDPPAEAGLIADHWEPWVEAIAQDAPPPDLGDSAAPEPGEEPDDPFALGGDEIWEEEGGWWTRFPPPDDFDGEAEGSPGLYGYRRRLTAHEEALIEADEARLSAETVADEARRRDLYFTGIAQELAAAAAAEDFSPREAETYETSSRAARA